MTYYSRCHIHDFVCCRVVTSSNVYVVPKLGGSSGAVVKASCLETRRSQVQTPFWPSYSRETKLFFPAKSWRFNIVKSLRDQEVACSSSDRHGSNFEFCVWRAVAFHLSHRPQEVLLAQFSLQVHTCGLRPPSFHFILSSNWTDVTLCTVGSVARRLLQYLWSIALLCLQWDVNVWIPHKSGRENQVKLESGWVCKGKRIGMRP